MNIETPKSPDPETPKKPLPKYVLILMFGLAAALFFRVAVLVIGPVPGISKNLVSTYVLYVIGTWLMLHFFAFYFRSVAPNLFTKNTPRYLEYMYSIIISLGLLQIIVSGPKLASYIEFIYGNEQTQLAKIRISASSEVAEFCAGKSDSYWTLEYCDTLRSVARASYLDANASQSALDDIIRHGEGRTRGDSGSRSTTASRVILLNDFKTLSAGSIDQNSSNLLTWLALILLPIGIGLRLLKTSLELF